VVLFFYTSLLQYSLQLTTESDSDKLSSEKKDISFQNHSDNGAGKDNTTHTHNTLPIFCTCSPHIYRGLKVGYDNTKHSVLLKTTPPKCFHALLWKYTMADGRNKLISPIPGHNGQRTVTTVWCDYSRNVFVLC